MLATSSLDSGALKSFRNSNPPFNVPSFPPGTKKTSGPATTWPSAVMAEMVTLEKSFSSLPSDSSTGTLKIGMGDSGICLMGMFSSILVRLPLIDENLSYEHLNLPILLFKSHSPKKQPTTCLDTRLVQKQKTALLTVRQETDSKQMSELEGSINAAILASCKWEEAFAQNISEYLP